MTLRRKIFPAPRSIRRRLFWLLGGVGLGTLLIVNLTWLPGAIREIREAQAELQRVAVRGARDQIQLDRKSTRLNSSHIQKSRMPSSA